MDAERVKLETARRELTAQVSTRSWMQDQTRATLTRLSIERGWAQCAENEAAARARTTEKPAKLVAEAALADCREWERLLSFALENGAYPFVSGYMSREDMVTLAELKSREAALARVLSWRSGLIASAGDAPRSEGPSLAGRAGGISEPIQRPAAKPVETPKATPPPPQAAAEESPESQEIVITATRRGGCRVRLADRTLTERELVANARAWAANGTPLRVVRPARSDYHCLAKIAFQLGEHGVRLIQFVDRSDPQ